MVRADADARRIAHAERHREVAYTAGNSGFSADTVEFSADPFDLAIRQLIRVAGFLGLPRIFAVG